MRIFAPLLIALSFLLPEVQACSFVAGYSGFEPNVSSFKRKMVKGVISLLPAPTVTIDRVVRGKTSNGAQCGDAGIINISIDWPQSSAYRLEEIGFYFQSENGLVPDLIFPLVPIRGQIEGNQAKFQFVWLDGHPKKQKELNFKVTVFAVNNGLEIGTPQTIVIKADRG
jgi:hypothetical protein